MEELEKERIVQIEILVYWLSYKTPSEQIMALMVEDPGLDQAMEQLAQQIRDGGKEVFKVEHNIIYAENGYIVGIYEAFIKILIEMKQMMLN